ncbi:MAG TPA: hypothetical protein VJI32_00735 [Candidatus Nanoarchaeia archaeon]|nr:hypothetical protein [Candidatus Nanoarchaeia archaeon]
MEPIVITVCIEPSAQLPGQFLAFSNYELMAQGGGYYNCQRSFESVVRDFLTHCPSSELPLPGYFSVQGFFLEDTVERQYKGLPPLVFKYYHRVQN